MQRFLPVTIDLTGCDLIPGKKFARNAAKLFSRYKGKPLSNKILMSFISATQ